MNDMPIASGSLDYVYACEVLHHNDSAGLRQTFEEAYRILKPGGKLLVVNETLKTLQDPVGVHPKAVAQFEGYEHAHWAAAIPLGGRTRRLLHPAAGAELPLVLPPPAGAAQAAGPRLERPSTARAAVSPAGS